MNNPHRLVFGLTAGCAAAFVIAVLGFYALRTFWPEYAAAVPHKTYSPAMLISRLSLGVLGTVGAACVTTIIVGNSARTAWLLGGLFFLFSLPSHLYYGWSDYPAWYHFVFLGYLIPLAGLTGQVVHASRSTTSRATH